MFLQSLFAAVVLGVVILLSSCSSSSPHGAPKTEKRSTCGLLKATLFAFLTSPASYAIALLFFLGKLFLFSALALLPPSVFGSVALCPVGAKVFLFVGGSLSTRGDQSPAAASKRIIPQNVLRLVFTGMAVLFLWFGGGVLCSFGSVAHPISKRGMKFLAAAFVLLGVGYGLGNWVVERSLGKAGAMGDADGKKVAAMIFWGQTVACLVGQGREMMLMIRL